MNKNLRKKISLIAVTALIGQAAFLPMRGVSAEEITNSEIEMHSNTEDNAVENTDIDEGSDSEENKTEDIEQENNAEENEEQSQEDTSETESQYAPLKYALFSGSNTRDLRYSGWKMIVNGDIHTNSKFISNCSELYVNGKCEAVDDIWLDGWIHEVGEQVKGADAIAMSGVGHKIINSLDTENAKVYNETYYFCDDTVNLDKDIIVNGDATFRNTNVNGSGFVVAENNITFDLNEFKNDPNVKVCYYAKNGDIVINASNSEINGILCAPNGRIIFEGYNLKLNGRMIADQVVLNGSLININASDSDLDVFNKKEELPKEEDKQYTTFGDAKEEDGVVEITPLGQHEMGGIWYNDTTDTTNGFEVNFDYWAGGGHDQFSGGADGIVVNFADSKNNLNAASDGTLGFNGEGTYGVEFDSYKDETDPEGNEDGFKHIAIIKDSLANHLAYKIDKRVDNGCWYKVKLVYKENKLYVYVDGEEVLQQDGIKLNDNIFVGVSGSTGKDISRQLIKNISVESYNK